MSGRRAVPGQSVSGDESVAESCNDPGAALTQDWGGDDLCRGRAKAELERYREALTEIAEGRWNVGSGKPLKGVGGVIDSVRSFARTALARGTE